MPHMKAMNVLFHLLYGSLFCSKGLQSERPECWRMVAEAGTLNEHPEIRLFVPSLNHAYLLENFKFLDPMIAHDLLFEMRYGSIVSSKKWPSERPNCGDMFLRLQGMTVVEWSENRCCLRSLAVTCLFLRVTWAIIPHQKEDIQGYLLIYKFGAWSNW